jgi:hypothetical protein
VRGDDGLTGGDCFDGDYEAVAAAGERLDEAGTAGGVTESVAEAGHGGVDAVVVIDEGAAGPKDADDLVASDEFAGAREKQEKKLAGLGVQPDAKAFAAQLAGGGVEFEDTEAVPGWLDWRHVCTKFTPDSQISLDDVWV